MYFCLFLHVYQPSTQFPEMVKRAVETSYRPILALLKKYPQAKITLNICASLTELLADLGYQDVLQQLEELAKKGQIEFVGSAKYHPLLPKIPKNEILRQIKLNEETNRRLIGQVWQPQGFFPPELAFSNDVAKVLVKSGYQWVLLDESAHPQALVAEKRTVEEEVPVHEKLEIGQKTFIDSKTKMGILFRDREGSAEIAFERIETVEEFLDSIPLGRFSLPQQYSVLAMDGETFGLHHPKLLSFLEGLFQKNELEYQLIKASDIFKLNYPKKKVELRDSTWGRTIEEEKGNRIFPRWNNPQNSIHRLQWELLNLALQVASRPEGVPRLRGGFGGQALQARELLDQGLQSDQFWWASHNPCWHPPMIEGGARLLLEAIELCEASKEDKEKAKILYKKINSEGLELYGKKIVGC